MKFRPWGKIKCALSLTSPKNWNFLGVLGTETRSLCAWSYFHGMEELQSTRLIKIIDEESPKYAEKVKNAFRERVELFQGHGGSSNDIYEMILMTDEHLIFQLARQISKMGSSIALDITSFPKRFFFPILKVLVKDSNIKNLILTYTSPQKYAPNNEPLYEEVHTWDSLPGFGDINNSKKQWVVSVGFLVESLRRHIGDNTQGLIKLLIPFPAPLSVIMRTWEAVSNLEANHSEEKFEKIRVETTDISAAFDRICSIESESESPLAFAPFGPKTTSVAMCLYAIHHESPVYYLQPTIYHPNYSIGIKENNPESAINAYWIKHEGENFY